MLIFAGILALNNLGILDSGQNRVEEAQKEYEEALKIHRELAQKEPEAYLPQVAMTLNNGDSGSRPEPEHGGPKGI